MDMKVFDSLCYGKENAIPSKHLAKVLGFQSVRDLQKQIERERAAGAVILSNSCSGGYYLSNDPEELRRFTRTLNARARNTMKAAESAQRALDAATKEKAASGAEPSESGNDTNDTDESVNDSGILPQKARFCNEKSTD